MLVVICCIHQVHVCRAEIRSGHYLENRKSLQNQGQQECN